MMVPDLWVGILSVGQNINLLDLRGCEMINEIGTRKRQSSATNILFFL